MSRVYFGPGGRQSVRVVEGGVAGINGNGGSARREELGGMFDGPSSRLETEYDARFPRPPSSAYEQRPSQVRAAERLSWWNGAAKEKGDGKENEEAFIGESSQVPSFFQDKRVTCKKHVPGHFTGEESVQNLLADMSGSMKSLTENHEKFKAPPRDWPRTIARHQPPESIQLEFLPAPSVELTGSELAALRNKYEEEMLELGFSKSPRIQAWQSEQRQAFASPRKQQGRSDKPLRQGEAVSEYRAAFANSQTTPIPAAGGQQRREMGSGVVLGDDSTTQVISEYKGAFLSQSALQTLANERVRQAVDAAATRAERRLATVEDEAAQQQNRRQLPGPNVEHISTEYRDRFETHLATSSPKDKGRSQRGTCSAVVSEYEAEFDHLPSEHAIQKKKESLQPLTKDDLGREFTSEYEGQFCGQDQDRYRAQKLEELRQLEAKNKLKPAYALKPSSSQLKHHLFQAEINPGFVQRSEYMRSFDSRTDATGKSLQTFRLHEATRAAPAEPVEDAPVPPVPPMTHDQVLAKQSEMSLNWWNKQGRKAWEAYNPVTQNIRYAPYDNLFKTPSTEYQRSFPHK